jgi:hypothetical protein
MSVKLMSLIAVCVVFALALAGIVKMVLAVVQKRKDPASAPPPVPTALSLLAGFSFFSGLSALALVVVAAILFTSLSMGEMLQLDADLREAITVAAKIVLYVSLLPSVAAVAFALAARGSISESGGTLRGRPLYRTGVLLAILSGAVVFDARVLNPATWAAAAQSVGRGVVGGENLHRAYLGVETGPLDSRACVAVLRVVPGSPADRAGLKPGDLIVKVDGLPVHSLPPCGRPGVSVFSPGSTEPYVGSYIETLSPGTRVNLEVRRGDLIVTVVAELSASFESLLALLQTQSFDAERLAVLKAAGLDRRYSAEQLMKICETFDFDQGRLQAIEPALPHLQDPKNSYRILGALEFPEPKAQVGRWIGERLQPSKPSRDE